MSTTLDLKDIGMWKSEFVARTQFLWTFEILQLWFTFREYTY